MPLCVPTRWLVDRFPVFKVVADVRAKKDADPKWFDALLAKYHGAGARTRSLSPPPSLSCSRRVRPLS